ncbi:ribosome recycling factor [bacterium]|jgi:ribosome recycling factor|nr:ribosome recycling factor [bacterium]MBT3903756.1 ribosome recycling factor [bacterium]MBT4578258.1 ribosome recycling factor [bacterium]MBT5345584.1 ribosome recycling factor [bacterium]MBT6131057.1 ribosome recycling factor [bacterium]
MNKEILIQENTKLFEQNVAADMTPHIEHFEREIGKIRTGRAHTSVLENIMVDCYGSARPLKELAGLAAPEASLLTVQPWDQSVINDIERALQKADLGATPANDGHIIRLRIPPMSAERRQDLVKQLQALREKGKVAIRGTRKDVNNIIKKAEKDKDISKDMVKKLSLLLQTITDKFATSIDETASKKEQDIIAV